MDTLYLVVMRDANDRQFYVGYVIINMAAVKIMSAQTMEDVEHYVEEKGFKQWKWRIPKETKYQMIRVKQW